MSLSPPNMYASLLRNDLTAFIHRSFLERNPKTQLLMNFHIEAIAAKLEEVRLGKCKRLIISMPPRHLKTHAISVAFVAWLLGHEPTKQILCISYAQDLSDKMARDCRTLMNSDFYRALFDTRISKELDTVAEYETTEGGFRLSTSIGGVVTGRGADIIVIDDPIKAEDAISDARRSSTNGWYDRTLSTRLNNQERGAIILVMQRLHADDLAAHVQRHQKWDVLSFPAIAEADEVYTFATPYGERSVERKTGQALQPELVSLARLEELRRSMTDYNFSAQYQQNPQPPSGIIVQRAWLKFYEPHEKPERFDYVVQSWDTANKESELANYSVCTTWGIKDRKLYLLDVLRRRMNFPALKAAVRENATLYGATHVLVEDKASGTSLIQELQSEFFGLIQPAPSLDGDKIMRLHGQTAKFSGGFVLLPKEAHWLGDYVSELLSFPNSKYDDQVDSTVYALAWSTEQLGSYNGTAEGQARMAEFYAQMMFGL